jgi:hypothetical protein
MNTPMMHEYISVLWTLQGSIFLHNLSAQQLTDLGSGFIGISGRVSEYNMPRKLLKDKSSCFAKLVAEYSERAGSSGGSSGGASTAL